MKKKKLLCKLGFHDFEPIETTPKVEEEFKRLLFSDYEKLVKAGWIPSSGVGRISERISNRVCLDCGEKDLRFDEYLQKHIDRRKKALKLSK